jgi:hypothetical protein
MSVSGRWEPLLRITERREITRNALTLDNWVMSLISDAIRDVLLAGITGKVFERQHGQRSDCARWCPRVPLPRPEPRPRDPENKHCESGPGSSPSCGRRFAPCGNAANRRDRLVRDRGECGGGALLVGRPLVAPADYCIQEVTTTPNRLDDIVPVAEDPRDFHQTRGQGSKRSWQSGRSTRTPTIHYSGRSTPTTSARTETTRAIFRISSRTDWCGSRSLCHQTCGCSIR